MRLNLSGDAYRKGDVHFHCVVDGYSIAYAYIRKNACSAFKDFFRGISSSPRRSGQSTLAMMMESHLASRGQVASADWRICVLRDPVERLESVFKNKFVQRSGNADIFADVRRTTSIEPVKASFEEFVRNYAIPMAGSGDKHIRYQSDHLLGVDYNGAILIGSLHDEMQKILGAEMAREYFGEPRNSTETQTRRGLAESTTPAQVLAEAWVNDHVLPAQGDLLSDELIEEIRDAYACDLQLLSKMVK